MEFFFDVDGTLLPFGSSVPASASEAIRRLRADGHHAFLATGRSRAEVPEGIYSIGFDGGVFSAGADVVLGSRSIFSAAFTEEDRGYAMGYCREKGFRMLVQTGSGTYITEEALAFWRSLMHRHLGTEVVIDSLLVSDSVPPEAAVIKILYITSGYPVEKVREEIGHRFCIVDNTVGLPRENMGEIVLPGITKATGIDRLLEALGSDISQTVAFGDGANDIEMIEHAALGIAMGNSSDDLKAAADWIAPDIADDGLRIGIDFALRVLPSVH